MIFLVGSDFFSMAIGPEMFLHVFRRSKAELHQLTGGTGVNISPGKAGREHVGKFGDPASMHGTSSFATLVTSVKNSLQKQHLLWQQHIVTLRIDIVP